MIFPRGIRQRKKGEEECVCALHEVKLVNPSSISRAALLAVLFNQLITSSDMEKKRARVTITRSVSAATRPYVSQLLCLANLPIVDRFCVVQKSRSADFEALKSENVLSGSAEHFQLIHLAFFSQINWIYLLLANGPL